MADVETLQPVSDVMFFDRWTFDDVRVHLGANRSDLLVRFDGVNDLSPHDYMAVQPAKHATFIPHTAGRHSVKRFRKAQCPMGERLTNALMMHGRNNGKELMAVRIVKHAVEIFHLLTDQNPIQIIVYAIINSYPIEDLVKMLPHWVCQGCPASGC